MASIKFDNISFSYGDRQILKNFSLEVDDSQIMCLVGPSGCGKTTLIRCLLGFNKPSTGRSGLGTGVYFHRQGVSIFRRSAAMWAWCSRIMRFGPT